MMRVIPSNDLGLVGLNNIKKQFGAAVRFRRDHLAISQEELAGRAGLHRTYISDVERGARNVSLESIHRLADGLQVSLSALFSRVEENGAPALAEPAISSDKLVDILLVEESVADAEATVRALNDAGLANHVFVVRDGEAALDFLFCRNGFAQRRNSDRPQLILLNLSIPKVDGWDILRQIKAAPQTCAIPVVVLAPPGGKRFAPETQRLGAVALLVKPLDFQNLNEVTKQLSLRWALLKKETST